MVEPQAAALDEAGESTDAVANTAAEEGIRDLSELLVSPAVAAEVTAFTSVGTGASTTGPLTIAHLIAPWVG